jgi:hypothetical protein
VPCGARQNPQREGKHGTTFGDGGASTPCQRRSGNAKTDRVIRRVPEEVESIGLQGCRASRQTGDDLSQEESGVDDERKQQRAPPARAIQRFSPGAVIIMAAGHRGYPRQQKIDGDRPCSHYMVKHDEKHLQHRRTGARDLHQD